MILCARYQTTRLLSKPQRCTQLPGKQPQHTYNTEYTLSDKLIKHVSYVLRIDYLLVVAETVFVEAEAAGLLSYQNLTSAVTWSGFGWSSYSFRHDEWMASRPAGVGGEDTFTFIIVV
jgi:hypothetical protein